VESLLTSFFGLGIAIVLFQVVCCYQEATNNRLRTVMTKYLFRAFKMVIDTKWFPELLSINRPVFSDSLPVNRLYRLHFIFLHTTVH